MSFRVEIDSLGEQKIPLDKYWGPQTQRSLQNFSDIGNDIFQIEFIHAFAMQKMASAIANFRLGILDKKISDAICIASEEIMNGMHDDNFPLCVWQTGSGTQTNMNLNEVIANRAIEIIGGNIGDKNIIHPNDHVNKSQSSNDSFPTVMHISSVIAIEKKLIPSLYNLLNSLRQKSIEFANIVKIGRTHMQDATPLTLGDEFSGYCEQIQNSIVRIKSSMQFLYHLAQGGTAVGTGINAPDGFKDIFIEEISRITGFKFISAQNKFESIATSDAIVEFSGALNTFASSMMKIANDIRMLSSGPRCGIGEIKIPANEPGSSIMPGKVNPTQCEALTMVCVQVIGMHHSITIGGFSGHMELNVFRPMMIFNTLNAINLLSGAINSFNKRCVSGIVANVDRIKYFLNKSLMLVTALVPYIGYDKAAKAAKKADEENILLKDAVIDLGFMDGDKFDEIVDPNKMI